MHLLPTFSPPSPHRLPPPLRAQRVKLEREYLSLQDRAFNATGQQLVEVRQLITEEVGGGCTGGR